MEKSVVFKVVGNRSYEGARDGRVAKDWKTSRVWVVSIPLITFSSVSVLFLSTVCDIFCHENGKGNVMKSLGTSTLNNFNYQ